jgi:hypothetical protein
MKAGLIVFGAVLARMFLPLKAIFTPVKIFFASLILLLDDIMTWKEGGDSLFGDLYDWILKLVDKMKPLYDWIIKIKKEWFGGDLSGGASLNQPQETTLTDTLAFAGKNALKWGIGGAVAGSVLFKDIREGFTNQAYLDKGLTPPQANNKTDIVNNMSFNIKSTEPKEVANEVYSVLTGELKSTIVY